jgi:dolichol-phosphate mannosyltransferase
VVIPAYNEADSIAEVAGRAARHADVCVVDDASTDETGEIAASLPRVHCIRHMRNTHIAGGILDGFRYAREQGYDACITMDAGMSHDPDAIPGFLAHAGSDLILGYRAERENVPGHRRLLSASASLIMNMALDRRPLPGAGPGLRDCTSGYRMYSRRAFELLLRAPLRSRAFDFHIEALAWVYRAGLVVAEIPIRYRYTNSSLRAEIVWEALRTWAGLWSRDLRLPEEPG